MGDVVYMCYQEKRGMDLVKRQTVFYKMDTFLLFTLSQFVCLAFQWGFFNYYPFQLPLTSRGHCAQGGTMCVSGESSVKKSLDWKGLYLSSLLRCVNVYRHCKARTNSCELHCLRKKWRGGGKYVRNPKYVILVKYSMFG